MKGCVPLLCAGFLSALGLSAQPKAGMPPAVIPDPIKAGQELAAKLRAAVPAQDAEFTGKFIIVTEGGRVSEVPVASKVTTGSTNWQVIYQTFDRSGVPRENLRIIHTPGLPNAYFFSPDSQKITPKSVSGADLSQPLGRSDFWLMDLGLEFFHWPNQRLLGHRMSRSRSCYILESMQIDPPAGHYSRVVALVDVETSGLIQAEAFDRENTLVKQFGIGKLRKIDGQHQLENMRIISEKTGQETELKFDLKKR
jgi:hypothetical protein